MTFASAEGSGSVLDSVRVTGGEAARGGGILIDGASPIVVRCVVSKNRATQQGSGIWVGGGSEALIYNNVVHRAQRRGPGDPHGIEIVNAAPEVVNNTILRGDSNGLILRGASAALIQGNVFARNGSRVGRRLRGRGICDFSGGAAVIRHNLFHRNRRSAILRGGRDWGRIEKLESTAPDPNVLGNVDGNPRFRGRSPSRWLRRVEPRAGRSRARDSGEPGTEWNDLDDSRNDIGATGGPFAHGSDGPAGRVTRQ